MAVYGSNLLLEVSGFEIRVLFDSIELVCEFQTCFALIVFLSFYFNAIHEILIVNWQLQIK